VKAPEDAFKEKRHEEVNARPRNFRSRPDGSVHQRACRVQQLQLDDPVDDRACNESEEASQESDELFAQRHGQSVDRNHTERCRACDEVNSSRMTASTLCSDVQ
jgi:hypothetical protein